MILGISDSHDAGATLIEGGRIVAAINEERLSRKKQAPGLPEKSIRWLFGPGGVDADTISHVSLAGRAWIGTPPLTNDFSDDAGRFGAGQILAETLDAVPGVRQAIRSRFLLAGYRKIVPLLGRPRTRKIKNLLTELGVSAPLVTVDHHDAHVAAAYYTSGFDECLILSNDGFGDGLCGKAAIGRDGHLEIISSNSFFNSIGVYYNYVTAFCGFSKAHHAGKTTGLAAYGDPEKTVEFFRRQIRWDENRGIYINEGSIFRDALKRIRTELAGHSREDVAAGIQLHLEEVIVAMARHYLRSTGIGHLAVVGGIHANVKLNQCLGEIPELDSLYVFPHMGDGGLSAGAALLGQRDTPDGPPRPQALKDLYLGPSYSDEAIHATLLRSNVTPDRPTQRAACIAAYLADGKIVANFDGAMEYGPRALGNRSILYAAEDASVNDWLNRQLNRTEFMPFAPVVRAEDAPDYFENLRDATARPSAFMTITFNVTERCRTEAPAVVHVDGTARPQVLHRDDNPAYFDILTEYKRLTEKSILVNTSFNMHEEPLVCTPDQALEAARRAAIDVLAIGPYVVEIDQHGERDTAQSR